MVELGGGDEAGQRKRAVAFGREDLESVFRSPFVDHLIVLEVSCKAVLESFGLEVLESFLEGVEVGGGRGGCYF